MCNVHLLVSLFMLVLRAISFLAVAYIQQMLKLVDAAGAVILFQVNLLSVLSS